MTQYKENYPVGSRVVIASRDELSAFHSAWKYHHKLTPDQLAYAGRRVEVQAVSFYHGGDVLYELKDVPGVWHEECLVSLAS